jgi:hypothetical protein
LFTKEPVSINSNQGAYSYATREVSSKIIANYATNQPSHQESSTPSNMKKYSNIRGYEIPEFRPLPEKPVQEDPPTSIIT